MALILNKNIAAGEVVQDAINDGVTNKAPSQNAVFDALALKINSSEKGAANGVATLDAGGKVPVSQLPNSIMEYQGVWNANTNSPSLADGSGSAGDVYRVSVAGSQNLGSGSISFDIGDYVIYNGSIWEKADTTDAVASVNGNTGVVVLDTDDISEGSSNLYYTNARFDTRFSSKSTSDLSEGSNLYFTEARVLGTDLAGYAAGPGGETVAAADTILEGIEKLAGNQIEIDGNVNDLISLSGVAENAVNLGSFTGSTIADNRNIKQALQDLETELESVAASPISYGKESKTLVAGDITNQYIDLAQTIKANSLFFMFSGLVQREGTDYSVNLTGGAGGVTRVTFLGDLATGGGSALVATDVIYFQYAY